MNIHSCTYCVCIHARVLVEQRTMKSCIKWINQIYEKLLLIEKKRRTRWWRKKKTHKISLCSPSCFSSSPRSLMTSAHTTNWGSYKCYGVRKLRLIKKIPPQHLLRCFCYLKFRFYQWMDNIFCWRADLKEW